MKLFEYRRLVILLEDYRKAYAGGHLELYLTALAVSPAPHHVDVVARQQQSYVAFHVLVRRLVLWMPVSLSNRVYRIIASRYQLIFYSLEVGSDYDVVKAADRTAYIYTRTSLDFRVTHFS